MATKFFNPADPFGIATGNGVKWEVQNSAPTTTKDRAQALKANGDELASQQYNARTSVSATYIARAADAPVPKFGAILGGYHVDSVAVSFTNTGYATMTLAGHKHGVAAHPTCRTYTGSLTTIGVLFGCPSTIVGCTIPAGAGVRSVQYALQGNHIDELGSAGDFLAAENHDGNETVTVELCDSGTITPATGWDCSSVGNSEGNTAAETSTGTFEKHLQADVSQ